MNPTRALLALLACCVLAFSCGGSPTTGGSRVGPLGNAGAAGTTSEAEFTPGQRSRNSSSACPAELPFHSPTCTQNGLECLYDRGVQQGCFLCSDGRWRLSLSGCAFADPPPFEYGSCPPGFALYPQIYAYCIGSESCVDSELGDGGAFKCVCGGGGWLCLT
jgi:hypothetical protein